MPHNPLWSAEEIEEIRRRAALETLYSSDEVRKYLRLLEEEVAKTGHCDEARAAELMRQLTPFKRVGSIP
jgi:hypothetical protein